MQEIEATEQGMTFHKGHKGDLNGWNCSQSVGGFQRVCSVTLCRLRSDHNKLVSHSLCGKKAVQTVSLPTLSFREQFKDTFGEVTFVYSSKGVWSYTLWLEDRGWGHYKMMKEDVCLQPAVHTVTTEHQTSHSRLEMLSVSIRGWRWSWSSRGSGTETAVLTNTCTFTTGHVVRMYVLTVY